MSGYGYRPPAENSRARGGESETERKRLQDIKNRVFSKATDFARQFEGRKKRKQEYKEKRQEAQSTGYNYKELSTQSTYFDPNSFYAGGSERYYKPPDDGKDFVPDTLIPKYIDIFGVNSPQDILKAKERYYNITGDGLYTETLYDAAAVGLDMFEKGELDIEAFDSLLNFYAPKEAERPTFKEIFEANNPDLVYKEPRNLREAKELADQAYMRSLQRDLERTRILQDFGDSGYDSLEDLQLREQQLLDAIEKGALDFQTPEDTTYILYNGQEVNNAAREQAYLMKNFLEENDIDLYKVADLEPASGADSTGVIDNKVWLNTGTALQAFETGGGMRADIAYKQATDTPTIGAYSLYETTPVFYEGKQQLKDAFNVFATVVGAFVPASKTMMQAANTAVQGEGVEDLAKNVVASTIAPDILENTLADFDIDADLFGMDAEVFSEGLTDIQTAIITGDSIKDAVGDAFGSEILEAVSPAIEGVLPDIDIPEAIVTAGDAVVSAVKPVLDTVEKVVEPVVDVVDTIVVEPIENIAKTTEDIVEKIVKPVIEKTQPIVEPVQQVVETAVDTAEKAVEPIVDTAQAVVDPIEEALGKTVEPVKEVLEETVEPVVDTVEKTAEVIEDKTKEKEEEEVTIDSNFTERALEGLGLNADTFGVSKEEYSRVMQKAQETMLKGGSGKTVVFNEFGVPVLSQIGQAAGSLFNKGFAQIENILKPFVDVAVNVVEPVVDVVETVAEPVIDVVQAVSEPIVDIADEGLDIFGETIVDPALQVAKDVGQDIIDVGSDVLSEAEDVFIDPIKLIGEEAYNAAMNAMRVKVGLPPIVEEVIEAVGDVGQTVIDVGSDVLSEAEDIFIEPIKTGIETVVDAVPDMPDIDLPSMPDIDLPSMPDIDLPDLGIDFSLPSLNLGGMLAGGSMGVEKTQTEKLFDKELFKFDTEIKSTQEMLSPMMNLRRYG
jgi:hypothetical protein